MTPPTESISTLTTSVVTVMTWLAGAAAATGAPGTAVAAAAGAPGTAVLPGCGAAGTSVGLFCWATCAGGCAENSDCLPLATIQLFQRTIREMANTIHRTVRLLNSIGVFRSGCNRKRLNGIP